MKVKLEVCLIFDAREVWPSTEEFESDFANFLLTKGLLGEKIKCGDEENDYYREILISSQKQEPMVEDTKTPSAQKRDIKFNLSRPHA